MPLCDARTQQKVIPVPREVVTRRSQTIPSIERRQQLVDQGVAAGYKLAAAGVVFGPGLAPFTGGILNDLTNQRACTMSEHIAVLPNKQPALRVMPMPSDANQYGDIFGGWIMSQVDIAGAIAAKHRARGRVATVAVDSFVFNQPVSVGDIVSFFSEVVATGRTSIKVNVEVFAERNPDQPITVKVTEATLSYVAINQQGAKRQLPGGED